SRRFVTILSRRGRAPRGPETSGRRGTGGEGDGQRAIGPERRPLGAGVRDEPARRAPQRRDGGGRAGAGGRVRRGGLRGVRVLPLRRDDRGGGAGEPGGAGAAVERAPGGVVPGGVACVLVAGPLCACRAGRARVQGVPPGGGV